jgi:putative ABC transport system substrate-binding protein
MEPEYTLGQQSEKGVETMTTRKKKTLSLFLVALALLLLTACGGKTQPKTYKIGFFTEGQVRDNIVEGFKAGMAELGYVEGENIAYVGMTMDDAEVLERLADFEDPTLFWPTMVQERLLDEQVDLIVTADGPTTGMVLAVSEDAGTPIVFTHGTGVAAWPFVESYAHPGGRVTGITSGIDESTGKRMELLKKISPDIKTVLWVYWPFAVITPTLELHRESAAALGLELDERPLTEENWNVAAIYESIQPGEVDAIFGEVAAAYQAPAEIAALAERDGLPNIQPSYIPGALAVYSSNGYQSGLQAASLVDKILRGEDPGSLPVEFPEKIELTIDLGVAEEIGLTIPDEVLRIADTVIPAAD